MFVGVGIFGELCNAYYHVYYLIVSFGGLITSNGVRELFSHSFVVCVRRRYLLLCALKIGCIISSPEPQVHQVSL